MRFLSWALASLSAALLALACASGLEHGDGPMLVHEGAGCAACHHEEAASMRFAPEHRSPGDHEGCLNCHAPHQSAPDAPWQRSTLVADCASCHAEALAEFRMPFRHPLDRTTTCTSCHAPHGKSSHARREHERTESCLACHLEYKGPYLYDHDGDETRGCISCHVAHGGPNRRLLTHSEARFLCLECHTLLFDLPHVQSPGSRYRDCLDCHTEVHGSNLDRVFTR